jgi:hypothetical protein
MRGKEEREKMKVKRALLLFTIRPAFIRHSVSGQNPVVSTILWMPEQVRHDGEELTGQP